MFHSSIPSWLKKWRLLQSIGNWTQISDLDKDEWWLKQTPFTTDMVESLNEVYNIAQGVFHLRQHWDVANSTTYRLLSQECANKNSLNLQKQCEEINQSQSIRHIKQLQQIMYETIVEIQTKKLNSINSKYFKNLIKNFRHTYDYCLNFVTKKKKLETQLKACKKLKRHFDFCIFAMYGGDLTPKQLQTIRQYMHRKKNREENFKIEEHLQHFKYFIDVFNPKYILKPQDTKNDSTDTEYESESENNADN